MTAKIVFAAISVLFLVAAGTILVFNTFEHRHPGKRAAVAAKTTSTTPKPVICVHCADLACFTSPIKSACAAKEDYCYSTVTDHSNGNRNIVKGCASLAKCKQAYNQTNPLPRCRGIDHQVSGYDVTCSFCCKGDNCNVGPQLIPSGGLPFKGKPIG